MEQYEGQNIINRQVIVVALIAAYLVFAIKLSTMWTITIGAILGCFLKGISCMFFKELAFRNFLFRQ
jgi:hypothetical protein